METPSPAVKEKRRNSEKRKEKSRDAARCRRSKESEIFHNLSQVLPLPENVTSHLDKASVMRLVIAHLRIRDLLKKMSLKEEKLKNDDIFESWHLKALGGVILVLSLDGEIIYISNNVPVYLGISQVDLLGHSIYDVCHPCDHAEIRDLLSGKIMSQGQVSVFLRLKCTLTSKGRNVNIKSASYKVLHITGNFMSGNEDKDHFKFVTVAHPIPHPVDIEAPLGNFTFLSKHSLDMKFTYADERMSDFLGYDPDSLIGKSVYNFHHALDNKDIEAAFKSLFSKGQSETGHYRFLAQEGGYVWVYTQATVIYCEKGNKPLSVVCVNYIVSEKLNESEIYSFDQLEWNRKKQEKKKKDTSSSLKENVQPTSENIQVLPQLATNKIFAPRTKDMNAVFLMFPDEDNVMKDEQEDLTHLAPTAGDVCVPLGINPLISQVMENYILPDYYSPLIDNEKDVPLFSSYRDDGSTGSLSPLAQSPGSLPSLCSLGEDSHFEDNTMKSLLSMDAVNSIVDSENDDISCRGPYIEITESDDLPLLRTSDLLWNVSFPPLGCSSNTSSARCSPSPMEMKPQEDFSSLAHLLQVDKEDTLNKYPDQGGGNKMDFILNSAGMDTERRKRVSSLGQESAKKKKQLTPGPDQGGGSSVLMNLLVAGRDISAGYVCVNPRRPSPRSASKRET